jgi:hypothetical protein
MSEYAQLILKINQFLPPPPGRGQKLKFLHRDAGTAGEKQCVSNKVSQFSLEVCLRIHFVMNGILD